VRIDSGDGLETHPAQNFRDLFCCVELTVAQFRVLVKPASPFDYLGLYFRCQPVQLAGANLSVSAQREQEKEVDKFSKHDFFPVGANSFANKFALT